MSKIKTISVFIFDILMFELCALFIARVFVPSSKGEQFSTLSGTGMLRKRMLRERHQHFTPARSCTILRHRLADI